MVKSHDGGGVMELARSEFPRSEHQTHLLMNELEDILLKKGWPVPLTPYYLIHHEKMLQVLDQLRLSLQEDLDSRFLQSFAQCFEPVPPQEVKGVKSNFKKNPL
jgi:hypothetical protein